MGEKREKKILEESGCNVGIDMSFRVCYYGKKVESNFWFGSRHSHNLEEIHR